VDNKLDLMIEYIRQRLLRHYGSDKSDLLVSIHKEMAEEGYSSLEVYIMVNVAVMRNIKEIGDNYKGLF